MNSDSPFPSPAHAGRRCRRPRFRAQSRHWLDARTLVSARLGGGRSVEFHARRERPLVFLDQGRAGADALRDVPRPRAVRRVHAARRRPDRSARAGHDVRAARRAAAQCRSRAPHRTRAALRSVPEAQGATRSGRPVRCRAQARVARASACNRHRHVIAGGRAARRADDACAPRAAYSGDRLSGAGAGRGRERQSSRRWSKRPTRGARWMC